MTNREIVERVSETSSIDLSDEQIEGIIWTITCDTEVREEIERRVAETHHEFDKHASKAPGAGLDLVNLPDDFPRRGDDDDEDTK